MMARNISFQESENCNAQGRNGISKVTGIYASVLLDKRVYFAPINSKNRITNCYIEFPVSRIDEVCNMLQLLKEKTK